MNNILVLVVVLCLNCGYCLCASNSAIPTSPPLCELNLVNSVIYDLTIDNRQKRKKVAMTGLGIGIGVGAIAGILSAGKYGMNTNGVLLLGLGYGAIGGAIGISTGGLISLAIPLN